MPSVKSSLSLHDSFFHILSWEVPEEREKIVTTYVHYPQLLARQADWSRHRSTIERHVRTLFFELLSVGFYPDLARTILSFL